MARIEIYFGEMGSGKSHNARLQAERSGIPFLEGDDLVPPEMVARVLKFKPLTREMVSELVARLIEEIKVRVVRGDITVAQALYLDADRRLVDEELRAQGHEVVWFWVRAGFIRNMKQLLTRPKGLRWVAYWLSNKPFFERPTHRCIELED